MADGEEVTEQDLLALHEDILEGSEEAVRELLDDFREDDTPTLVLCTREIQVISCRTCFLPHIIYRAVWGAVVVR